VVAAVTCASEALVGGVTASVLAAKAAGERDKNARPAKAKKAQRRDDM
jgi:hypothetical protein